MKFVIHKHTINGIHYDLMLESGNKLFTIQIKSEDLNKLLSGQKIVAPRIDDHRKKYLTYEGPISCNRGKVVIYDQGQYTTQHWSDDEIRISISGAKLKGLLLYKLKTTTLSLIQPE